MRINIMLAGVGGQGILSQAYVMCNAALSEGLNFRQAEVHGMAQRGGAVQSMLRISDGPISSDLIPKGECELLLSVEPMEALRYLEYLRPDGTVVTSINPFVNIPNYPKPDAIYAELGKAQHVIPIDAVAIAKCAGSQLAANMVMLGAASVFIPLKIESMEIWVGNLWQAKGEKVVEVNVRAFHAGRKMAEFLSGAAGVGDKVELRMLRALAEGVPVDSADPGSVDEWVSLLQKNPEKNWMGAISDKIAGGTTA